MSKKIFLILLLMSGFVYADVPEIANDFKCQQIIIAIKQCGLSDKICKDRNVSIGDRYKICKDAQTELLNLQELQLDDPDYFNKLSYMPIKTYIGLRKLIQSSLMSVTKNSERLEKLKDTEKKEIYNNLKKIYNSAQGRLIYIDKHNSNVALSKNIQLSKEWNFISNENLLSVEEDVSVLMIFYDFIFTNYTSFREGHALIAELYPNGVEGELNISRTGANSYSLFECTVINRLLNFTEEPMLDLVYERACLISFKDIKNKLII